MNRSKRHIFHGLPAHFLHFTNAYKIIFVAFNLMPRRVDRRERLGAGDLPVAFDGVRVTALLVLLARVVEGAEAGRGHQPHRLSFPLSHPCRGSPEAVQESTDLTEG